MILEASHTHFYPGHRGKISGLDNGPGIEAAQDCLVTFSDGSATTARLSSCAQNWRLETQAYQTAAGNRIAAKHWILQLQQDGDELVFHILNKAP